MGKTAVKFAKVATYFIQQEEVAAYLLKAYIHITKKNDIHLFKK